MNKVKCNEVLKKSKMKVLSIYRNIWQCCHNSKNGKKHCLTLFFDLPKLLKNHYQDTKLYPSLFFKLFPINEIYFHSTALNKANQH